MIVLDKALPAESSHPSIIRNADDHGASKGGPPPDQ